MKKDYFIIFIALCCFSLNAQLDIPDSNFENYLETHNANGDVVTIGDASSMGDGVLNNLTLISKVEGVTELYVSENNIASLQGIEAFTNLEILHCRANQLEVLDISQNLALVELECESNQFSTLDVSNNLALKVLGFGSNNLSSIDVSNNLLLEAIWFVNNNISSLNLDVNTALRTYGLSNNPLVYMSIQNGNNTNVQYIEALNLPSLSCIQVDNATAATYLSTNFSFVDESLLFSEDCGYPTIAIPDVNFEQSLIDLGIDTNGLNGNILETNAEAVTILNLTNPLHDPDFGNPLIVNVTDKIADLTGIEAFVNLTYLSCGYAELTEVDISNNVLLDELFLNDNQLTSIDVTANTLLTRFGVMRNQINTINVSSNTLLEELFLDDTGISSIDVSSNLNLWRIHIYDNPAITSLDLSNNPDLIQIRVQNNTSLSSLDIRNGNNVNVTGLFINNTPLLTCINTDAIVSEPMITYRGDKILSTDCSNTTTIAIPDSNFEQALIDLGLDTNGLNGNILETNALTITELYISDPINNANLPNVNATISDLTGLQGFTNLVRFVANDNSITSIDVTQNTSLEWLFVKNNQLPSIDISNNLALTRLYAEGNTFSTIDVSNNAVLDRLVINDNQITTIDVTNNILLTRLELHNNQISTIDVTNNTLVKILYLENNLLTSVDVSQNTSLLNLAVGINPLTSLDVSMLPQLPILTTENTLITSLDLSLNVNLLQLWIAGNPNLTSIDLSSNTLLWNLGVNNTPIANLDLSNNPITRLYAQDNANLSFLDLRNGSNVNMTEFYVENTPNLTCINTDAIVSEPMITYRGDKILSTDCSNTTTIAIPDSNFEQALINLGFDTNGLNGNILETNALAITNLNVNNSSISSLQGIEAFANLEILFCQGNQLEDLDVSQNLALVTLECESNQFSTLDVSNNTALKVLGCANNNLSSIDVSNNLLLEALWFTNNNITSLNLDINTALNVYGLSNNPLVYMSIQNGNNANMQYIEAQDLPTLTCIQVDDENAAYLSSWNVDSSISFSENCGTVYIPDANFENYLETHNANGDVVSLGDATSMGDGVLNNLTLKSKVETVTSLIVNDSNIVSLQGVEGFTNLEYLNCNNNPMANLDVSQNANLDELSIDNLLITEIDLSNNLQLKYFYAVGVNNLTNIDFSVNTLLINLLLNNSKIEILNLSNNSSLTFLLLRDNLQLTYLNLRNNNNLNLINCDVTNNPNLLCINADANISQAMINTGNTFSEDCGDIWTVYTSDTNLDAVLSSYGSDIDTSGDGEITLNEAAAYAGTLDLSNQDITDIEGLQAFTSVTEINLSGNNISDLSVLFGSNAVVLTNKQAEFKTVTSSSFSALLVLDVSYNSLTSIDVSEVITLVELNCSNNLLNSLNIKNGNNAILTTFEASNNTALSCIQVDNAADASSGLGSYSAWNKDTFAIYSEDCSSALSTDDNNLITSLSIFPNPVKDVITVNAKQAIENITIYNIMGQKVNSFETLKNNQIDVSGYPKGFYIMSAEINGAIQSLKFLKE